MATVTTDAGAWVDDDAFLFHRQGICRTDFDALAALDAGIRKEDRSFAFSLDLPADVLAEYKRDDE